MIRFLVPTIAIFAATQIASQSIARAQETAPAQPAAPQAAAPRLPMLFIIGDSTVRNGTKGLQGWGDPIAAYFDAAKITVSNRARGGRSSRTYLTEGLWNTTVADLKAGDFVLMQFGHNDGGSPEKSYRASLKGNGDDAREVENPNTHQKEMIQSYGWYLRKYIADTKAKGATPIVLSMVPRNDWENGKVGRASQGYGKWALEAAQSQGALFLDLNEISARHYEAMGQEKVKAFFPQEHTHTDAEGAELNARSVIEGLKGLKDCALCADFSDKAADVVAFAAEVPPTLEAPNAP
jgi:lysophospholipase L1-like esterase